MSDPKWIPNEPEPGTEADREQLEEREAPMPGEFEEDSGVELPPPDGSPRPRHPVRPEIPPMPGALPS